MRTTHNSLTIQFPMNNEQKLYERIVVLTVSPIPDLANYYSKCGLPLKVDK